MSKAVAKWQTVDRRVNAPNGLSYTSLRKIYRWLDLYLYLDLYIVPLFTLDQRNGMCKQTNKQKILVGYNN